MNHVLTTCNDMRRLYILKQILKIKPLQMLSQKSSIMKRLNKEFNECMLHPVDGIDLFPDDTLLKWTAIIEGNGVYLGYSYKLDVSIPTSYPFQPPNVQFMNFCYHPNVNHQGNICLDILQDKWSPAYSIQSMLLSIQSLLSDPNCHSPLNGEASKLWGSSEYLEQLKCTYEPLE
eukprot:NODE_583_length_5729_cov_0.479574.p5 type:complete len:175 gc:universal NODE_583_length_5729_cov_0.479574:1071-1595(+)